MYIRTVHVYMCIYYCRIAERLSVRQLILQCGQNSRLASVCICIIYMLGTRCHDVCTLYIADVHVHVVNAGHEMLIVPSSPRPCAYTQVLSAHSVTCKTESEREQW